VTASPARLSVEVSLRRPWSSMSPSSFLSSVHHSWLPYPSSGSAWAAFPVLIGTVSSSDFPTSIPRRSVFLRFAVPRERLALDPSAGGASTLGEVDIAVPFRVPSEELWGSPRFLGDLIVLVPRSTTPVSRRAWLGDAPMLPSARNKASASRLGSFRGSITQPEHSLCTLHAFGRPRRAALGSGWLPSLCRAGLVTR